jgi:hypothetical protein
MPEQQLREPHTRVRMRSARASLLARTRSLGLSSSLGTALRSRSAAARGILPSAANKHEIQGGTHVRASPKPVGPASRFHLHPRIIPVDHAGVPTHDELVLAASRTGLHDNPAYRSDVRRFVSAYLASTAAARRHLACALAIMTKATASTAVFLARTRPPPPSTFSAARARDRLSRPPPANASAPGCARADCSRSPSLPPPS